MSPRLALAWFFLAALLSCRAVNPDAVEVSASRAESWLLGSQNPDGSWGSFETLRQSEILTESSNTFAVFSQASSALAVIALLPTCRDEKVRASALKGLRLLMRKELRPRSSPTVFYDVWAHSYRLECFCRCYQSPFFIEERPELLKHIRASVAALLALEGIDGGFAYYDFGNITKTHSGKHSTSFNIAVALRSLRLARSCGIDVPEARLQAAADCLRRCRMPDGAFTYAPHFDIHPLAGPSQHKGAAGRSSVCWLGLADSGEPGAEAGLRLALQGFRLAYPFLISAQGRPRPHEGYYQNAGYYVFFGHFYAMEAAGRIGDRESSDWIATRLIRLQSPDGSFLDFPLYSYGSVYGTAFALRALREHQSHSQFDGGHSR
ncbi:MAG: hypothetical protein RL095_1590 [Verrucomicrobiota bacterium]|jgi:hypothetical protein